MGVRLFPKADFKGNLRKGKKGNKTFAILATEDLRGEHPESFHGQKGFPICLSLINPRKELRICRYFSGLCQWIRDMGQRTSRLKLSLLYRFIFVDR